MQTEPLAPCLEADCLEAPRLEAPRLQADCLQAAGDWPPAAEPGAGEASAGGPSAGEPSPDAFRRFMGRWPTGVGVIGMLDAGTECGMTANSLVSVSLSPLLVAVSVRLSSRAAGLLVPSAAFAVSILAHGQERIASWFAWRERGARRDGARRDGDSRDGEFAGIPHAHAPCSGVPYLRDGVGFLHCVVDTRLPAGDHAVVIGRVGYLRVLSDQPPLVFYRGGWSGVADT